MRIHGSNCKVDFRYSLSCYLPEKKIVRRGREERQFLWGESFVTKVGCAKSKKRVCKTILKGEKAGGKDRDPMGKKNKTGKKGKSVNLKP